MHFQDGGDTYGSGTATAGSTSTTTTATGAAASRSAAAGAVGTLTLSVGSLGLLAGRLGLASELDRNLALEDLLAGEFLNGTFGLGGGREVDEGVADRAVGARVLGDRNGLTVARRRLVNRLSSWVQQHGT